MGVGSKTLRFTSLAMAYFLVLGCKSQGGVSSGSLDSGSSSISGTLNLDLIYPTSAGPTWEQVTESSRIYIIGLSVTASGRCSLGTDQIKVDEGGSAYSEVATCTSDGDWVWSKTYTAAEEGDKTLTFKGYTIDGSAMTGSVATATVRVDNTAPSAPVVTTPGATPYNYSGTSSSYTFAGTVTADTVKLTVGNDTITPVNNAWTYDVTLVQFASTNFTFYAWDRAGNRSVGTTNTIQWNPSAQILAWGPYSGGITTPQAFVDVHGATTTVVLEASVAPVVPVPAVSATNDHVSIWSGFNELINQLRAL